MIASDALALGGITHGFFTREGGHSTGLFDSLNCGMGSGDDKDTVLKNRATVAERLGVEPDRLLSAWQVHSPDAVVVSGAWPGDERPRVDALVRSPVSRRRRSPSWKSRVPTAPMSPPSSAR